MSKNTTPLENEIKELIRVAEADHPYLGSCYYNGRGVERDLQKAFYWHKKSAELGETTGMNDIAVVDYGFEIPDSERVMWLKKAADSGDGFALCNLGSRYLLGKGVERDEKLAIQLLKKSAEQQDTPSAFYVLYMCYTDGRGVRKNRRLALENLRKSAELGYPKARKVLKKLESGK
jgi:TPR repeat protein